MAADKAIASGSPEEVERLLTAVTSDGIHEHFKALMGTKSYDKKDIAAGREHVEHYVRWAHYVNGVYAQATEEREAHFDGGSANSEHDD